MVSYRMHFQNCFCSPTVSRRVKLYSFTCSHPSSPRPRLYSWRRVIDWLLKDDDYHGVGRRLDSSTEEEVDILVACQCRRTQWQTEVDHTRSEPGPHTASSLTTSRYTARWPLRHATLPDRLQIITKRSISAWWSVSDDMCTICRMIILVLVWRKSIHFWRRYAQKKRFLYFCWLLRFVTLLKRYVSTELEVSKTFEKIWGTARTDGRTDGVQHLTPSHREGRIITLNYRINVFRFVFKKYCRLLILLAIFISPSDLVLRMDNPAYLLPRDSRLSCLSVSLCASGGYDEMSTRLETVDMKQTAMRNTEEVTGDWDVNYTATCSVLWTVDTRQNASMNSCQYGL